ncbi:MAG: hypothetical protein H6654_10495 [Ardenticatenaceae bacterium]|nr:hypothetical protein [Anaerolineales bacterium]MCB8938740.1 hypothetical protein [Ardenticatenaceae bacterium]MCB8973976.1 hypothetical protein [Ardenticatenaceae bacterium]
MRKTIALLVGFLVMIGLLATTGSARAGGWATVTVSELPAVVVAERPFTIEFSVRQHGQTLLPDLDTAVTAVQETSSTRVNVQAKESSEEGFYTATLTLPQSGEWRWGISSWGMVYPMPPLLVNEAVAGDLGIGGETAVAWQLVLGWLAAAGAALYFLLWTRQRSRVQLAGLALLGVVSLASFALHAQMPVPVLAESETDLLPAIAPDAMGEALFVAKGCIQCHVNDNVTMAENMFQIGPDITFVKRPSEYLEVWLANPASIKVETIMPNLHLSAAEIETLIAFLKQQ